MGEGIDAEGIDFTPNPIYINPKNIGVAPSYLPPTKGTYSGGLPFQKNCSFSRSDLVLYLTSQYQIVFLSFSTVLFSNYTIGLIS